MATKAPLLRWRDGAVRRRPVVAHVVGARPNYMKVAPVYAALERRGGVEQRLIHTGQHYDAAVRDAFFAELPLPEPHAQLAVGSGLHGEQTGRALTALEETFLELKPDLVLVPGDVNSTLAAGLAAVKLNIPVCHLEAGLRSNDWTMPEEHNRKLTDHLSTLLLTHSEDANENLASEGIPMHKVAFVGNTMIDTLFDRIDAARQLAAWRDYGVRRGKYVLVTLHRPALVDVPELLAETMRALNGLAASIPILFPVHPRTRKHLSELGLEPARGLHLLEPQAYGRFLSLQADAAAVVTDSGGVQEETTALGVPCFTLRNNTERPVTVTHGTNTVLGLDPARLVEIPRRLAEPRSAGFPPLWDGQAGDRAAAVIERALEAPSRAREHARPAGLVRRAGAMSLRRLEPATGLHPAPHE
jgi:UDP-N-acetylglucosamine 2-epimerase (non-hydrolysing)